MAVIGTANDYIFGQEWEQERDRLAGLGAQFDPVTIRHLTAVGVGAGWSCLEVGGGEGSIARWLSAAVGAAGRVVVTDIDTRFLDELSGPNVTVVRHDVTCDPLEREAFDLVHARAVLEHVPGRSEVVQRLVTALRPGGVLVLEDVVFSGTGAQVVEKVISPPQQGPVMTRLVQAMAGGFRAVGADPEFGLELPAALTAAGLRDVTAELTHRLVHGGSAESAFYALSLRELGPRLIAAGLLDPEDAERGTAFVQDSASRWLSLGMVTASGRRPEDADVGGQSPAIRPAR
jgi:SAM-dependent methyltransferase